MTNALQVSEISARSPDMSDADFSALIEDIRKNGQLVPIWTRGGEIIDGRKRFAACKELGIEPQTIDLAPDQDAEAISRALNILRTHYTPSQRAMFAAERANATRATGRQRRLIGELPDQKTTVAEAARESAINESSVQIAKKIKREAAPEITDAIKSGKLTLHAGEQIMQAVAKPEQAAAVAKVIEANRGKARNTPVAKTLNGTDGRRDRAMPKPGQEQFSRAIRMLDVACEIIAKQVATAAKDARRKDFTETLKHCRTTLTRAITALEIAA